jgi:hypothetical protein
VTVTRYVADAIVLSGGVAAGEIVVTAGVQLLRPGQKVAPVEGQGSGR